MTYQGFKGYRPIVTAFKELPLIAYHRFRDGNAIGSVLEAIEEACRILPKGKRIRHASLDSEFYSADVINFLRRKGTTFAIAVDKDSAVREAIKGIEGWEPFRLEDGTVTDREIAETIHTMNKTDESFRLIVQRWRNEQVELFNRDEYKYHAIATNLESSALEVVWEYHDRGQMENIIGELLFLKMGLL